MCVRGFIGGPLISGIKFTYCLLSTLQNSRIGQETKDGKESKSISNELASAINDGLYFFEQV